MFGVPFQTDSEHVASSEVGEKEQKFCAIQTGMVFYVQLRLTMMLFQVNNVGGGRQNPPLTPLEGRQTLEYFDTLFLFNARQVYVVHDPPGFSSPFGIGCIHLTYFDCTQQTETPWTAESTIGLHRSNANVKHAQMHLRSSLASSYASVAASSPQSRWAGVS